ncbi:hypothetical protein GCM10017784_25120 [Deinococcus indicus]|nr:hypothetical protein GCM10017784_25120 [Deinococcus indicus]
MEVSEQSADASRARVGAYPPPPRRGGKRGDNPHGNVGIRPRTTHHKTRRQTPPPGLRAAGGME